MDASIGRWWSVAVVATCALASGPVLADINFPDPDVTPPLVSVITPMDGAVLPEGMTVMVTVGADDPPPESSGIAEVWILIDDDGLPVIDEDAPWEFSAALPNGPHTVRAYARDWEGNEGSSNPVTFTVGMPQADDSGGGPGETAGGSGSATTSTPATTTATGDPRVEEESPIDRGCACASARPQAVGARGGSLPARSAWALLLLALGLRPRSARNGR